MPVASSFVGALALAAQSPADATLVATIPDGLHVATELRARSNRGDHVERSTLAWSSDGRVVAYVGRRGDAWFPVVGSELGESYDMVSAPIVAGGRVFFHVGRTSGPHTQQHFLWVDGTTVGPEDWMGEIAVSPDGEQAAYWTWPGAKVGDGPQSPAWSHRLVLARERKKGQWSVTRGEKWAECGILAPMFSADGERVLACAVGREGYLVLELAKKRERELTEGHPSIDAFASSADGRTLAFVRTEALRPDSAPVPEASDRAELWFAGERVGARHSGITLPTVDPRGDHVACVVDVEGGRSVAIDGEARAPGRFDHVLELAFDPTGRRIAFVANRGGAAVGGPPSVVRGGSWFVVLRSVGAEEPPEEGPAFLELRDLAWDASGRRLAYAARDEQGWRAVCGDTASDPHDHVGAPRFSPDGKSLLYGTRDGRELWWRALALE